MRSHAMISIDLAGLTTMAIVIVALLLASSRNILTRTSRDSVASMESQYNIRRSSRINSGLTSDEEKMPVAKEPSTQRKRKSSSSPSSYYDTMPPLLNLGKLVRGTLIKRPSASIRSPYVADVSIGKGKKSTSSTILAHAPALDVGGMCISGSEVYLSKRSGEGKTSHSIELVRGAPLDDGNGVLVGAHPRLGESIAEEILKLGLLEDALTLKGDFVLGPVNSIDEIKKGSPKKQSPKKKLKSNDTDHEMADASVTTQQQVATDTTKISMRQQVTLGDSRADFQMTLTNPDGKSHRVIVEVKNVVCADYEAGKEPTPLSPGHCVVVAQPPSTCKSEDGKEGYQRTALFPWGRTRGQKFEGKTCVSERACKHLRNLQSLLDEDTTPVVLFIVNRSDCESIRACHEKCPVFAEVLAEAVNTGVKALAVRVRWTEEGECFFDGIVPVTGVNNSQSE